MKISKESLGEKWRKEKKKTEKKIREGLISKYQRIEIIKDNFLESKNVNF